MQIKVNKWHTLHTLKTYRGDIDAIGEKYNIVMQEQKTQKETILKLTKNDQYWVNERVFPIYPDSPVEWYNIGFDFEFKEHIRNKFNRKCFLCSTPESTSVVRLDVHHIDYNKQSLDPDNFVPLCKRCHAKTNCNRVYWQGIINNKLFLCWLGFDRHSKILD